MRCALLTTVLALGLVGTATAAAEDPSQPAVWAQRTLPSFTHPLICTNSTTQGCREASCDQLQEKAETLLTQLGMRENDFNVDARTCYAGGPQKSIEVTFSVLVPADNTKANAAGPVVEAQWQTVALKGDCAFLNYATKIILPLFTTRNVKLISRDQCNKLGIGLYAQILKAPQATAASPSR
jgi:hypothetical protein